MKLTRAFAGGGAADGVVPGVGTDLQPFGVIVDAQISSIRFHNRANDGFDIDNISGRVPETASLALLGLGVVGLGLFVGPRR